jgi:HEPN domain-containing protein
VAPPGGQPNRAQLAEVAATIAEAFHPERIVLFSSHAYGVTDTDGDVDLIVVMDTPLKTHEQATAIRQTLDLRPSFPLDILVQTPEQIAHGLAESDFFVEDVIFKGITLYARDGSIVTDETEDVGRRVGRTAKTRKSKEATRGWLAKADADLAAARRLGQPPALYEMACCHAQQSAEKDLDGYLEEHGVRSPRTCDLGKLADLALPLLPNLAALRTELVWLTDFAAEQADYERAIRIADDARTLIRAELGLQDTETTSQGGI